MEGREKNKNTILIPFLINLCVLPIAVFASIMTYKTKGTVIEIIAAFLYIQGASLSITFVYLNERKKMKQERKKEDGNIDDTN